MDAWKAATALAAEQAGVIARAQLTELGITPGQMSGWVESGRIERLAPRVWRISGSPSSWMQRLHAGLLSLGDQACVSHSAAAQLHGFDRTPLDRVEFTVPREARTSRMRGARVHSTTVLPALDTCRIRDVRVTSATRTIIDLARARVPRVRLEAAIDSAVRSRASAPVVLKRRLVALRGPGRWGCRLLDELLVDSGGETRLERKFLELGRRAGLPRPILQKPFRSGARTAARADFVYEEYRIVIEVTGRIGHSSPAERAKDAHRRNELQWMGFVVYEYTWEQVTTSATSVQASLRTALTAAGWPG